VFMKTFRLATRQDDTTTLHYWETRFLIKKLDTGAFHMDWWGVSYKWNAAQTDANLVSVNLGFDTVFYFTSTQNKQIYKKWHFPSQTECGRCHHSGQGVEPTLGDTLEGRAVLGFFPAQLKRPNYPVNGVNQLTALFTAGVFTGTQPNAAQLGHRFRGMKEGVPNGLSGAARFAVVDTMARSYIAANCSGCHSFRGAATGAQAQAYLIYNYENLVPKMEFGMHAVGDFRLNDTSSYDTTNPYVGPSGRAYYLMSLRAWGMNLSPGQPWDMALPDDTTINRLVFPGYPALSEILFRQWARQAPWADSGSVSRYLKAKLWNGGQDSIAAQARLAWLFSNPWGSVAWRGALTAHGLTIDSILKPDFGNNYSLYTPDQYQMPPLATFIPDTAPQIILGEWAKTYRSGAFTGIKDRGLASLAPLEQAFIRDHVLFVPASWLGKALMLDIRGRVYKLQALRKGAYSVPANIPSGVYFFRIGAHSFITSMF